MTCLSTFSCHPHLQRLGSIISGPSPNLGHPSAALLEVSLPSTFFQSLTSPIDGNEGLNLQVEVTIDLA
jgi:hypothetical protein